MGHRAIWKGHLELGALSCAVALHAAVSEAERIRLHIVDRRTRRRVRRQFVDEETGRPVARDAQVKGYDTGEGRFVVLEQAEIDAVVPPSTHRLEIAHFVPADAFDPVFRDRPYFLVPTDRIGREAFAVIRAAMQSENVLGLGRTVLFRRDRMVLLAPLAHGLAAATLHFDYEVREADTVLDAVPKRRIDAEMIELARHIIRTKRGDFEPATFGDRYEAALAELIRAKQAGRKPPRPRAPAEEKVVDLREALRRSAGAKTAKPAKKQAGAAGSRRKAG
ncbi:non-homologous end joining protein Ku [Allostella sp. ATCC 35155]|nr:non-homologous end joining protein Ku [Stella sp. ATCC 35155]